MKQKIYFLILLFIIKVPLFAQTTYWVEEFNTNQGWALEDNWSVNSGMLQFYWSPEISNFDQEAISPVITLHESIADLIITQYLDIFWNSETETAEISIVTSQGTEILWSYGLENGTWGTTNGTDISFPLSAYAGEDVQFKFRTFGSTTYNWNWWNIFELKLTVYLDHDLSVVNISGPNNINIQEQGTWEVVVKNSGLFAVSDFTVNLFCNKTGNNLGTINDFDELEPLESKTYSFDWIPALAYNTTLTGIVVFEGDEFLGNNHSKGQFLRINPDLEYNILVWDNDNGIPTVKCPVQGDDIEPAIGLTRVLQEAGIEFEFVTYLPDNLYNYDMIFCTMGCFCVS
jgi:hypothetical protein